MPQEFKHCDCCHWSAPGLKLISIELSSSDGPKTYNYCNVCYMTEIAEIVRYSNNDEIKMLARAMGMIANILLDAIERVERRIKSD